MTEMSPLANLGLSRVDGSLLTREKLITTRWKMGLSKEGEITTSFYLAPDGRIAVYKAFNETTWQLDDGVLRIFDDRGAVSWKFDAFFELEAEGSESTQLLLVSGYQKPTTDVGILLYLLEYRGPGNGSSMLAPMLDETVESSGSSTAEDVRLLIWDLDDTFWEGTLSEGAVRHDVSNAEIVDILNKRGIVSSICSKNDQAVVEVEMKKHGTWDLFVFPQIAFAPKGEMIAQIIKNAQLRPSSVMFIDDNIMNINEAKYYNPGLQVAEPSFLTNLLDDPRFRGKADPEQQRLQRYKVLQQKVSDQVKAGDTANNVRFLQGCDIRISIHADVNDEFSRVHDLVNRTNQMNFTKIRWPEDPERAREQFAREQAADFYGFSGYVKVSDRYGSYGICGFFLVTKDVCRHFLFSCRVMNMGVEQFVWSRIGRPYVATKGLIVSDLDMTVDWIKVVEDADVADPQLSTALSEEITICIRGACDMAMTSNFLRTQMRTIEELTFAYQGWEICSLPRIVALHEEMQSQKAKEVIARLPGMPPARFETDLIDLSSDVYVLSFSQESFQGLYRSRSTGIIIPMGHFSLGHYQTVKPDYTKIPYSMLQEKGVQNVSFEQWTFFQEEFEFFGGFNELLFISDIRKIFSSLKKELKQVVIVGLNSKIGRDTSILAFFGRINEIVQPLVEEFGFDYVNVLDFIKSEADLAADGRFGGPHFARKVYLGIANAVLDRVRTARRGEHVGLQ